MSSKHIRGDYNVAWPGAELAVMGAEGAVQIIHRNRIKGARDAEGERARLVRDYQEKFANPYKAASLGYLDDVIEPSKTREKLAKEVAKNFDNNVKTRNFYIQINTGNEPQKSGLDPLEADMFIKYCINDLN